MNYIKLKGKKSAIKVIERNGRVIIISNGKWQICHTEEQLNRYIRCNGHNNYEMFAV